MPASGKRKLTRSNAHFKKAITALPLGVSSNFRFWGEDKTIYVDHGRGGRIQDIDGNEYVDYRMGYGPGILGYADPRVDKAAREGMEVGGVFALSTELEYDVAKRISRMVPAAELVRFSNSGTEAVMAALRLARAFTGKDSHVIVEGGYHGIFDSVLWYADIEEWGDQDQPPVEADSDGVPGVLKPLAHFTPLNDANHLEDLLKQHHRSIGAFLIEPMMGNCCSITAERNYVLAARELCHKYGVIMIVDEVKTGFRVARGGVQELMGFKADLCTFAKAMGNGYPISAVAGREDIMRQVGNGVVHGGTYTCHSVSLAAAECTLQIIEETDALETIADYGERLQQGMSKILGNRQIDHSFVGHPSMGGLFFHEQAPSTYRDWLDSDYTFYDAMAPELHELGVLCEPDSREPWFICEAHAADDSLELTLDAFEIAVDVTTEKLKRNVA
ncbi:MAG: aminotransferase class III-fold pyridoxal phosphate-dependent enzyme [Xanthomonadales bacterium]|nr:aminotransferase class III-fold pyridoxal phosphate-dependent enzyme [Xanthomonadales bacterium]NNL95504.1 aminotransferase class III-fold pyridoxal phosphate-dependent enzyme [Xanthomonadales bacterium]